MTRDNPQPSSAHEGEWNARRESIIAGIIEDYFANGYEDVHEAIDELDRILRERLSALSAAPASPVEDGGFADGVEAAAKILRSQLAGYDHGNNQEHAFAGEVAYLLEAVEDLKPASPVQDGANF